MLANDYQPHTARRTFEALLNLQETASSDSFRCEMADSEAIPNAAPSCQQRAKVSYTLADYRHALEDGGCVRKKLRQRIQVESGAEAGDGE